MIQLQDLQVVSRDHLLAESPAWGSYSETYLWVDIEQSAVFQCLPGGLAQKIDCPLGATSVRELARNELLVTGRNSIYKLTDSGQVILWLDSSSVSRDWRFNDSFLTPEGALLVGTKSLNNQHVGQRVARFSKQGFEWWLGGLSLANGMALSLRHDALYVSDSVNSRILRWRLTSNGELRDKDPEVHIANMVGEPDGLAIDREDRLWVAEWGTGRILVFSPDGAELQRFNFSTPYVSSLAWVGPKYDQLLVTTARINGAAEVSGDLVCSAGDVLVTKAVNCEGVPARTIGSRTFLGSNREGKV